MTLASNLRKARFRDVSFEVEEATSEAGRRLAVHEFPGSDHTEVEDLGAAQRFFTLSAFVTGEDFLGKRDRLLAALEEEGPGDLVHPFRGTLRVRVSRYSVFESTRPLGRVELQITFALVEPPPAPLVTSGAASARVRTEDVRLSARKAFAAAWKVDGLDLGAVTRAQAAVREALDAYDEAAARLSDTIGKVQEAAFLIRAVRSRVRDFLGKPAELASQLGSVLDVLARALEGRPTETAEQQGAGLSAGVSAGDPGLSLLRDVAAASRAEEAIEFWRTLLVRVAVRGPQGDSGAGAPVDANGKVLARLLRAETTAALALALIEGPLLSEQGTAGSMAAVKAFLDELASTAETYEEWAALAELRAEVARAAEENALRKETRLSVSEDTPLLCVSWDAYGSALLADELAEWNHAPDPLRSPKRVLVLK